MSLLTIFYLITFTVLKDSPLIVVDFYSSPLLLTR